MEADAGVYFDKAMESRRSAESEFAAGRYKRCANRVRLVTHDRIAAGGGWDKEETSRGHPAYLTAKAHGDQSMLGTWEAVKGV